MRSEWILGRLAGSVVDSNGSGKGPVVGCSECGDEPLGSRATELITDKCIQTPLLITYINQMKFHDSRI
jgi:hypothetical protein